MKLVADFHTHSRYSRFNHGKDTIEELVHQANELGLKELAITDHGYKNFFGTNLQKMRKARKIIDDINTWSKTKILLGVEADLISVNGDIDIDEETFELIDVLLVGYHRMIKTDFVNFFGFQSKKQAAIDRATSAYINAIEKYPITVLTHLDSVLTTDLYKIGCACKENGVMIEINNRHVNWTKKQVDELIRSDCMFVLNSDAHSRDDVGNVERAIEFIKKYKIPTRNIANMEFTEDEMTAEDLEDQIYYDVYKKKLAEQEEKNRKLAAQNGASSKLSKEMEDALEALAKEQGIDNYHRYDNEVKADDIFSSESYQREVDAQISEMRAYIKERDGIKSEDLGENQSTNTYESQSYNSLPNESHENKDLFRSEAVYNNYENNVNQPITNGENLATFEQYQESRPNTRETVEFNDVKLKDNNFVSSDNVFYGTNVNVNYNNSNSVPYQRDSNYESHNVQEEQVNMIKKENENDKVVDNDVRYGQLKDSYDEWFDSGVDSSNFDIKDTQNFSNKSNGFMNFGGNQNYQKSQNSNTFIQRNNQNSNINNYQNNSKKSPNSGGNFFSETGNVLGVSVKNNEMQKQKTPKQTTNNKPTSQQPTRLGNGLIDFSSLTDDEE